MEEAADARYAYYFRVWWAAGLVATDPAGARAIVERSVVDLPPEYEVPVARLLAYVVGRASVPPPPDALSSFEDRAADAFMTRERPRPAASARAAPPPEGAIAVARNGFFFSGPGGVKVDLRRRPVLRRVLTALAARVPEARATSLEEIIAEGWPDERIIAAAAAHRAYMAITTLRGLGLRDHLISRSDGYRLEQVIVVDP